MSLSDLDAEIKNFRSSEFFQDVIWQRTCVLALPRIITRLLPLEKEQFRTEFYRTFEKYIMLGRMGSRAIDAIFDNNSVENIKRKLMDMFQSDLPPLRRLESITSLNGIDLFFGSYLLSASHDGAFIVYQDDVLNGVKESLPNLAEVLKLPGSISELEEYFDFNDVCRAIRELLGFKSLAEVHEFFWHRHKQGRFVESSSKH